METIKASDLKTHCLAILDRVCATGERVLIVKHGQPVAELGPATAVQTHYPQQELLGTVEVLGDIIGPALPETDWESNA